MNDYSSDFLARPLSLVVGDYWATNFAGGSVLRFNLTTGAALGSVLSGTPLLLSDISVRITPRGAFAYCGPCCRWGYAGAAPVPLPNVNTYNYTGQQLCSIATCNAGYNDCNLIRSDGCETLAATDVNNCGGCGSICANLALQFVNNYSCSSGMCGIQACSPGWNDCDGMVGNGCETQLPCCVAGVCGASWPNVTSYICTNNTCAIGSCAKILFPATAFS